MCKEAHAVQKHAVQKCFLVLISEVLAQLSFAKGLGMRLVRAFLDQHSLLAVFIHGKCLGWRSGNESNEEWLPAANQTPLLWCNIVPSVYVFLAHSSSLIGILKDANFIWLNYKPQNPIFSFSLLTTVMLLRRTANSPSFFGRDPNVYN